MDKDRPLTVRKKRAGRSSIFDSPFDGAGTFLCGTLAHLITPSDVTLLNVSQRTRLLPMRLT